MLSPTQFSQTHGKLEEGGFTVNPRTGDDVTAGIAVAPLDNEQVFQAGASQETSRATTAGCEPGEIRSRGFVGGWITMDNCADNMAASDEGATRSLTTSTHPPCTRTPPVASPGHASRWSSQTRWLGTTSARTPSSTTRSTLTPGRISA